MTRLLLILVFLCQHIVLAAEPIVLHLPGDEHPAMMDLSQPHSHGFHQHDEHHPAGGLETGSQDASSHDHVKHLHGHADIPPQQFLLATGVAGSESYLYHSQLTGITHTPPVPPPNA